MINHSPAQLIAEIERLMDMDYELLPGARHVLEEAIAVIRPLAEAGAPQDDQELELAPIIPGRNPRNLTITESRREAIMRPAIVSDDYTIINTQGIRFVEKVDQSYGDRSTTTYQLRVTYKGDKMDFRYKDAALRDAQFARLCAAMDAANKWAAVNR